MLTIFVLGIITIEINLKFERAKWNCHFCVKFLVFFPLFSFLLHKAHFFSLLFLLDYIKQSNKNGIMPYNNSHILKIHRIWFAYHELLIQSQFVARLLLALRNHYFYKKKWVNIYIHFFLYTHTRICLLFSITRSWYDFNYVRCV